MQIVLDEGHRVKDVQSQLSLALAKVTSPRRIVLTGYTCRRLTSCDAPPSYPAHPASTTRALGLCMFV